MSLWSESSFRGSCEKGRVKVMSRNRGKHAGLIFVGLLVGEILAVAANGALLTFDLRVVGSANPHQLTLSSNTDPNAYTVKLELWAVVNGGDSNHLNDAFRATNGSFISGYGGLKGNMRGSTDPNVNCVVPFKEPGAGSGAQADLDADGDKDVGSYNTGSPTGFPFFIATSGNSPYYSPDGNVGQDTSFLIGRIEWYIDPTTWSNGATTTLKYIPRYRVGGTVDSRKMHRFVRDGTVYDLNGYGYDDGNMAKYSDPNYDINTRGVVVLISTATPPYIGLAASVKDNKVIVGGTTDVVVNISNTGGSTAGNLGYTLDGNVPTITGGPQYGILAHDSNEVKTLTFNTGLLSPGTRSDTVTVTDSNAPNSPQSASVSVDVLDHSHASLSSGSDANSVTIALNALKGGSIGQGFSITNRAPAGVSYTAKLNLDSSTDPNSPWATDVATFTDLAPGGSKSYTATLSGSTAGLYDGTVQIGLSDQQDLPGHQSANAQTLFVYLMGVVGNATADKSNSMTTFGTELSADVVNGASYADLESTVTGTTGSGGAPMVGSTAKILSGTNDQGTDTVVVMSWRTRTQGETTENALRPPLPAHANGLLSDVVNLTGTDDDTFVLQMDYDPNLIASGFTEQYLASNQWIYLAWLNPNGAGPALWENAVKGNVGGTDTFVGLRDWQISDGLGSWGVNDTTHTAWAVVNHNSKFAVVPEPATMALVGLGMLGLLARRRRSA